MKLSDWFVLRKLRDLETVEEKSFWIVAPTATLIGLLSLFTAFAYSNPFPTIIAAVFCFLTPFLLMVFVAKNKNYHTAYPILCISIGAIATPITFVYTGGFLSSMPLFSVVTTGITSLCYRKRYRFGSFFACLAGNTLAFLHVFLFGSPYPIAGSEPIYDMLSAIRPVYNDMILGYYFASAALFVSIHFVINDIRRYKINQDALQQFFDENKRKQILSQVVDENVVIGSQKKKAAILFADISSFTTITEKMSQDDIAKFLNLFFTMAGEYIHSTNGIIDKYIGDCVMAYWLDDENSNCVLNAVEAVLELKKDMVRKSEQIYKDFSTELNFSAGIAFGEVIFGDIGSDNMHDFTIIGDAVNIASRIETFAAGGEILISNSAAKMVQSRVELEPVESGLFFKGKNKPIDIYRIRGFADDLNENIVVPRDTFGYAVRVCGCRGSFPVSGTRFSEYGGETSCYIVRKDDYAVIVDCGTGLKNAVNYLEGCSQIDILLTHVHYDHILGLLMSHFPENAKIRFFGHFSAWNNGINTLKKFMNHPYWPVDINKIETIDIDVGSEYALNQNINTVFYNSDHPDNGCVITLSLNGKKVTFLFDCERATTLPADISDGSELLFFDGMYDDNDVVDHTGWGHGTWQDGVRFFRDRDIKKLVITHHSPELGDHSLMLRENNVRQEFTNISFAKIGDTFII